MFSINKKVYYNYWKIKQTGTCEWGEISNGQLVIKNQLLNKKK